MPDPNPTRYPVFCPIPDPILKNATRWALHIWSNWAEQLWLFTYLAINGVNADWEWFVNGNEIYQDNLEVRLSVLSFPFCVHACSDLFDESQVTCHLCEWVTIWGKWLNMCVSARSIRPKRKSATPASSAPIIHALLHVSNHLICSVSDLEGYNLEVYYANCVKKRSAQEGNAQHLHPGDFAALQSD